MQPGSIIAPTEMCSSWIIRSCAMHKPAIASSYGPEQSIPVGGTLCGEYMYTLSWAVGSAGRLYPRGEADGQSETAMTMFTAPFPPQT